MFNGQIPKARTLSEKNWIAPYGETTCVILERVPRYRARTSMARTKITSKPANGPHPGRGPRRRRFRLLFFALTPTALRRASPGQAWRRPAGGVDATGVAATREGVCGSVFQLVDPTTVDQKRYIELCGQKGPVRPIYTPRVVLYGLALALECLGRALHRNVPLTRYKVRSITSPASFDCSAATKSLGWSPRVGTEAGLKATFTKCENTAVTAGV